jgi:RNA polymerase sigma-70 factor (ECF subfamily)
MKEKQKKAQGSELNPALWVERYGDDLYRYALFRLRDPAFAEDLVQETFLAALRAKDQFRGHSSEKTWLIGILKHKVFDHFRRTSHEQPLRDSDLKEEVTEEAFDEVGKWKSKPMEWSDGPTSVLEQKEFWKVFRHCLFELPDRLAHAFILRELEGLKSDEIRHIINVSSTNLGVIMYRARMGLRHCLEKSWFGRESGKE